MKARALVLCFIVIVIGGYMSQTAKQSSEKSNQAGSSAQTVKASSRVSGEFDIR